MRKLQDSLIWLNKIATDSQIEKTVCELMVFT